MQIDLTVRKENDPKTYTITCDLAERLVFGRSIESPVNLAGSEISREHFVLLSRNGQICVQDLSSNGTLVNGRPVAQKKPQKLSGGDIISVPGYKIELARHLPITPARKPWRLTDSRRADRTVFRWGEFTVWEMIVIAAAIASFLLIMTYVMH